MVDKTKSVDTIQLPSNIVGKFIRRKKVSMLREALNGLLAEVKNIIFTKGDYEWIKVENKPFYYVTTENMVVVDIERKHISWSRLIDVPEFNMGNMSVNTAQRLFRIYTSKNPLNPDFNENIKYIDEETGDAYNANHIWIGGSCDEVYKWYNDTDYSNCGIKNHAFLKLPIYALTDLEAEDLIRFFLEKDLNLFSDKIKGDGFELLAKLFNEEKIIYDKDRNQVDFSDKFVEDEIINVITANGSKILSHDFNNEPVHKKLFSEKIKLSSDIYDFIRDELLSCDETRVHMEKYSEHILKDPESGHWDLWFEDGKAKKKDFEEIKIDGKLIARNPVYDALNNRSGIVGIDFGTKSTVVTYRQSRADVLPMRIGSGQYKRAVSMADYENPTVMELRDVVSFRKDYNKRAGRPLTHWNDLLISHEAFSQLKDEQRSGDTFATFFSELKQWANDKERQVSLRDANGVEIDIPPYMRLKDGDFDPIEIYAYYLGMFINNMDHKIYLRYKMSFPAKIEKAVRDKILKSFERGIKKSLPQAVLDNEECMKIFRVEQGASEPAAYAICALQEYGFDPGDDEKMYYGIFDFGGGTTDFDFGIWSSGDEDDDNHDYNISRFGEGEDPYLGGENILGVLAYNVFLDNYDELRKNNIIFTKPYGERDIAGKDWLISQDSQYAHFNSKHMMEKLRGVWENDCEIRESVKSGTIQLNLFDRMGESHLNFPLTVSLDKLDAIIEQRIESGVKQFFSTLKNCFDKDNSFEQIYKIDEINIFLAGNSCKSSVVFKIFKKYIDKLYSDMPADGKESKKWIKVYPPLGSKQAIKIQKQELEPDIDKIIEDLSEDCKEISSKDCKEVLVRLKDEKAVEDEFLNSFIDGLRYSIEEGDKVFLEAYIKQLKYIMDGYRGLDTFDECIAGLMDAIEEEDTELLEKFAAKLKEAATENKDIQNIFKEVAATEKYKEIQKIIEEAAATDEKIVEIKAARQDDDDSEFDEDDITTEDILEKISRPNGKTGVAFGLLDTRVKIVQNESAESSFKYYLGQNRKKKFKCIIDKDKQEYGQWRRFCSASVDAFDIWFTRTADAPSNKVPINEIGIYSETGFIDEPSEEKSVYIKLVSPTDIEYTVSKLSEEKINTAQINKQDIERLTLQEK